MESTGKSTVAATRRLPAECEARLRKAYDFLPGDDDAVYSTATLQAYANGADAILITPAERFDSETIKALPDSVQLIATCSVGYEHIDLDAARVRGIAVSNTPDVLTDATADLTMLLLLGASRRAREGDMLLRSGAWNGLRPTQMLGNQITGKKLGILGMGRIGAAVAKRAQAFGMSVIYHNRKPVKTVEQAEFVESLEAFLGECDVLSLHCPLTAETKGILSAENIAKLKNGAVVINSARGPLVDDSALITALQIGKVSAAGLDVFTNEPKLDTRYLNLDNVFLLPHLGSATVETRTAMGMLAIDSIDAVLSGKRPGNQVV